MGNWLSKFGAQPSKQPKCGILWQGRWSTGIWTQRSPLRDAASTRIEEEFYGARGDALIDGLNCEISSKLTLIRRPGTSVYNSNTYPYVNRFYEYRLFNSATEQIKVLADTASAIYDVTGPGVGNPTPAALFTKSAGAGSTYFQSVGNNLYFSDGVDSMKLLGSLTPWGAHKTFSVGDFIIDSNGNIQSFQSQPVSLTITGIEVRSVSPTKLPSAQTFLIVSTSTVPPTIPPTQSISFSGLTTYTALNGVSIPYQNISSGWGLNLSAQQIAFKYAATPVSFASDTGTASTFTQEDQYGNPLSGQTGATPPVTWNSTQYGTTLDGTVLWECFGSPIENWQVPAPNSPPIVQPTAYSLPAAGSYVCNYWQPSMSLLLNTGKSYNIIDSNGNIETAGGNGGTSPGSVQRPSSSSLITGSVVSPGNAYDTNPATFSEVTGNRTASGHCQWEGFTGVTTISPNTLSINASVNFDDITGQASIRVSLDGGVTWSDVVVATSSVAQAIYTFPVPTGTNPGSIFIDATSVYENGPNGYYAPNVFIYDIYLTAAGSYAAVTTGKNQPNWSTSLGSLTKDNQVTWVNLGTLSTWQANYQYPLTVTILIDANGNLQYTNQFFQTTTVWTAGVAATTGAGNITGAAEPTWATTLNGTTSDGAYTWVCLGPATLLTAGTVQYAYSYHSIDGSVTTASPVSYVLNSVAGSPGLFELQIIVPTSSNPQIDQIWLWRTVGGGSTLFYLDQVPNNPNNGQIIYIDDIPDTSLNELIEAPIAEANDPPPTGLTTLVYYLQRIWGVVGNAVYYASGPDVTAGSGDTAWPPANVFVFPSSVTRLYPTTNGLFVFTVSDIYLIQGTGTTSSPFFSTPFLSDIGLVSYDAFSVNGSLVYMYTSDNQCISLDLNAGVSEVGFPIGDQFGPGYGTKTFNPSSTQVTWHIAGSQDKGLYISDGGNRATNSSIIPNPGNWWRLCPTPVPESGMTWSPKAQIAGGFSAVQSVETVPGTHTLLLGPKTSGIILQRDDTVCADNGTPYKAWAVLGSMVIAQPGQVANVSFFTTDSIAVGTPISLGVQIDEISSYTGLSTIVPNNQGNGYTVGDIITILYTGAVLGTAVVTSISGSNSTGPVTGLSLLTYGSNYPNTGTGLSTSGGTGSNLTVNTTYGGLFEYLTSYESDPPQTTSSLTTYAQRFYLSQTQQPAVCRHLQLLINWGSDTVANELLSVSLYGSFEQEN
jgi:hypothetical protein